MGIGKNFNRKSPLYQLLGLVGWLIVCSGAGGIGAIASVSARDFYGSLIQPSWAPPPWLFGPVWSTLYILMGISVWLVWQERGFRGAPVAMGLFVAQLAANALWPWLFFVWHLGTISQIEIVLLWVMIVGTIISFWRLKHAAALLLLPYLAWVSFATALTIAMCRLNPTALP